MNTSFAARPIPPCYIAFLIDASGKAKHFQQEVEALTNITENWSLDGSGRLHVSAASTGLSAKDPDTDVPDFVTTRTEWDKVPPLLVNDAILRGDDSPTSPTNDAAGIKAALNVSKPWLPCRMARRESILMVSIDGGSSDLRQLSYPSEDLFMEMNNFNQEEIHELSKMIMLNSCVHLH
ncbi:unnamed protein product [Anisakis simplex]|uniref:VWFA domain-containing protein n=1 Tax=Anisakis simplex TaxID=6269 RepID=A0A0M3IYT6_ANISI|nr:unnamed protein product [Anisakis simplex]